MRVTGGGGVAGCGLGLRDSRNKNGAGRMGQGAQEPGGIICFPSSDTCSLILTSDFFFLMEILL